MSEIVYQFQQVCKTCAQKDAVIFRKGNGLVYKTFSQLEEDVENMAHFLLQRGVKKGDRVLAFAPASYPLCVCMLSCMRIGASIMYVDIWAKRQRLALAFAQYQPRHVVVSNRTRQIKFFFREIDKIQNVINLDAILPAEEHAAAFSEIDEGQEALLTMTTGSTGAPKIAIRNHGHLFSQLDLVNRNLKENSNNEIVFTTSFIYTFANILKGFTTVLPDGNLGGMSPRRMKRAVQPFSALPITMMITSPDICLKAACAFPTLETLYIGGAILSPWEAAQIRRHYQAADIFYIYGCTECNLISKTKLDDYLARLKQDGVCILGKAVAGVQVKTDAQGSIYVTSQALLPRYLNKADDDSKKRDAQNVLWHKTGDAGSMECGVLHYYGRADRFFMQSEQKVFYAQAEQMLCARYPDVKKCAVLVYQESMYLFYEAASKAPNLEKQLFEFLQAQYQMQKVFLKRMKKIPCDVKHHTKIYYHALEQYLRKHGGGGNAKL